MAAQGAQKRGLPRREGRVALALGMTAAALSAGAFFMLPGMTEVMYDPHSPQGQKDDGVVAVAASSSAPEAPATPEFPVPEGGYPAYVPTPGAVRAIYMTQCVVGTPGFRADLVDLIDETELNSVIIDIKDFTGKLSFETDNPVLADSVSDQCGARDMQDFIALLHEKGIYVMGRITVFQDPYYSALHPELAVKFASPAGSVWKDHKGLSFIDVGAKPFWDYIIEISREAHRIGFDEINYDYVRFPSDGPMSNIAFDWAGNKAKAVALEEFFQYLHDHMKDASAYPPGIAPPVISADLFGMVTTNYDDLNIGQVLERALPYFDYIAPMVYPSHYPTGFNGWQNPNTVPYELIKFVMDAAVRRTIATESPIAWLGSEPVYETVTVPAVGTSTPTTTTQVATGKYTKPAYDKDKIRPWLQDFDYGGTYDVAEVKAQIQATYDAGLDSWMLWAPSNRYTRGALQPAE